VCLIFGLARLFNLVDWLSCRSAGLALATDIAPEESRPRVVALVYMMLLVGMFVSAIVFSYLLADFSSIRLIQVVQGAAAVTMVLNVIALWKQEPRKPSETSRMFC